MLSVLSSFLIISLKKSEQVVFTLIVFLLFMRLLALAVPHPYGDVGWSAVCDCGISWSHSLTFS